MNAPRNESARTRSERAEHLYLEASLPRAMVEHTIRRLAPLKIHMADPKEDRRWIELEAPASVELCPGEGVRVVTTGRFRFDFGKITIPAYLDRIEFMASPRIIQSEGLDAAAVPIEILSADVRMVPNLIDDLLVAQVNRALTPRASRLVWNFSNTLAASFEMPSQLEQLKRLELNCDGSFFQVHTDSIVLRVAYAFSVIRSDETETSEETAGERSTMESSSGGVSV